MIFAQKLTSDAGILKSIKTGNTPLEINDVRKVALVEEPKSVNVIRINQKVLFTTGVLNLKAQRTISNANRY